MDGNPPATGTAVGVDAECLDPSGSTTNNKKDYIAIPFAEVTDSAGAITYNSLFCLKSLEGKVVECK